MGEVSFKSFNPFKVRYTRRGNPRLQILNAIPQGNASQPHARELIEDFICFDVILFFFLVIVHTTHLQQFIVY